jgi:hypothetical protein
MADGKDAVDRELEAQKRRKAYRVANGLLSQAGIVLALSGIRPQAPEMEAVRRALRAVNNAGGIEKPRKEEVRAFPPGGPRFGRSAI